jgi:hypothetical protein
MLGLPMRILKMENLSREQQDSISQLGLLGTQVYGRLGVCDSAQTCVHDSSESLIILTVIMYE